MYAPNFGHETPYSYPSATGSAGGSFPNAGDPYRVGGRRSNIVMGGGGSAYTASPQPAASPQQYPNVFVHSQQQSTRPSPSTDLFFEEMFGSPRPAPTVSPQPAVQQTAPLSLFDEMFRGSHNSSQPNVEPRAATNYNNNISTNSTPQTLASPQPSPTTVASPYTYHGHAGHSPTTSGASSSSNPTEGRRAHGGAVAAGTLSSLSTGLGAPNNTPLTPYLSYHRYYDPNPQFGPIDSTGLRERISKSSVRGDTATTTRDIIVDFKGLLTPPPARDPNSSEIKVFLNMPRMRQALAQTYSPGDGGLCRGVKPLDPKEATRVDTFLHSSYWLTPVKGLRFVEYDMEVEDSTTQGNIRFRVIRGTLLGYFHDENVSVPTLDLLSPSPGRCAVWLPRGHAVGSVLDLSRARMLEAIRCKHCQGIVSKDESSYHLVDAHPERAIRSQQLQQLQQQRIASVTTSSSAAEGVPRPPLQVYQQPMGGAGASPIVARTSSSSNTATPITSGTSGVPFGATQGSTYSTYFGLGSHSSGGSSSNSAAGTSLGYPSVASTSPVGSGVPQPQQPQHSSSLLALSSANASRNAPRHDFFGSPTVVAEAASHSSSGQTAATGGGAISQPISVASVRVYTVRSPESTAVAPPVFFHRKSHEVMGAHYTMFETLQRGKKIGEGAQGLVSLCTLDGDQKLVVKDLKFSTQNEAKEFYQRCMRLNALKHVHLISYLAVEWGSQIETNSLVNPFTVGGRSSAPLSYSYTNTAATRAPTTPTAYYVSILMPFYPDGDVMQLLQGRRLEWYHISSLGLQIASALVYLHTLKPVPVIHGDIKPDNILLYSNKEQCVLMDLDTATECDLTRSTINRPVAAPQGGLGGGFCFDDFLRGGGSLPVTQSLRFLQSQPQKGTMEWMSPEGADGKKITTRSDVWSLGLVLFAMATLPEFMMFENPTTNKICVLNDKDWTAADLRTVLSERLQSARCPVVLGEVILRMVVLDPERRYSSTDALIALQHASEKILLGEA